MKTPDQEVAHRIIQEFREKQILSEKGVLRVEASLTNGRLRPEDWRLIFETDRVNGETRHANQNQ